MTRWWWKWLSKGRENREQPPTSHCDSLVVDIEAGGGDVATSGGGGEVEVVGQKERL